jgi:hypothetical protein
VPNVCAAINGLAALVLATVLAPGVSLAPAPAAQGTAPLAPLPAQARYVSDHLVLWRLGWTVWIVAALALLLFFCWWASRIGWSPATRAAVVLAAAGVVADVAAESRLIAWSPGQRFDLAGALQLSGVVANGAYSVAGLLLTSRTLLSRGLPRWLGAWSWTVWLLGVGLAVAAALSSDDASRLLTAALFVLFVPWLVVFGRWIA